MSATLLTSEREGKRQPPPGGAVPECERLVEEGKVQARGCGERLRARLVCLKPVASLLLHLLDTGSDALLCRQLLQHGDRWWAGIGLTFILAAGLLSAVFAAGQGVRGLRLVLYVLGCGPLVEVAMAPAIVVEAGYSRRLLAVRGMETLLEALPSSGFQLYMIIFRGAKDATGLQFFSAAISVLSAGYGVTAMLRDLPAKGGQGIISAARSLQGSLGVAFLVVLELLLYVVPMSLFFKAPEYRPWSITAVPAGLFSFELLLTLCVLGWQGCGRFLFGTAWALAACYSVAPRVMYLWRADGEAREEALLLWLSHSGQLLARAAVLPLAMPGLYLAWAAFGALAVCATALVWLVADAKARFPRTDEIEAPEDVGGGGAKELICFCL